MGLWYWLSSKFILKKNIILTENIDNHKHLGTSHLGEAQEVESQLDFETTKLIKQAHLLKTQTLAVCFEASNRSNDTNRNKLKGVHVMNHVVQGLNWYGGTRTYLHERSGGNRTYLHERS